MHSIDGVCRLCSWPLRRGHRTGWCRDGGTSALSREWCALVIAIHGTCFIDEILEMLTDCIRVQSHLSHNLKRQRQLRHLLICLCAEQNCILNLFELIQQRDSLSGQERLRFPDALCRRGGRMRESLGNIPSISSFLCRYRGASDGALSVEPIKLELFGPDSEFLHWTKNYIQQH